MAGARNASFAAGSRASSRRRRSRKAMELIAATRVVKAQQRVAAARPYSEQITEVIEQPRRGRRRRRPPAAPASASDVAHGRLRRHHRPTAAWPVPTTRGHPGRRARASRPTEPRARDYALIIVGKKAEGYFRFRDYRSTPRFARHSATRPTYEDARDGRRARHRAASRAATSTRSSSSTPQFLSVGTPAGRRAPLPAARAGGASRPSAGRRGAVGRLRVRAVPERDPRAPAAPLRRGPPLRRPARRRGLRARRPPAGHEVGHRQRRGPDHQAQPGR